jgi:hypothetical protein
VATDSPGSVTELKLTPCFLPLATTPGMICVRCVCQASMQNILFFAGGKYMGDFEGRPVLTYSTHN